MSDRRRLAVAVVVGLALLLLWSWRVHTCRTLHPGAPALYCVIR